MTTIASHALRFAVVLVALVAAPAPAQDTPSSEAPSAVPDELLGLVGDFILEQEDESLPKCPITLSDRAAPGGWAVELPEACPAPYPPADRLAAWTLDETDGSIVLLDAAGTVVLRLFEDEDGLYDTAPESDPRFYLMAPYELDGTGGEADGGDLEGAD